MEARAPNSGPHLEAVEMLEGEDRVGLVTLNPNSKTIRNCTQGGIVALKNKSEALQNGDARYMPLGVDTQNGFHDILEYKGKTRATRKGNGLSSVIIADRLPADGINRTARGGVAYRSTFRSILINLRDKVGKT
jgi:hypothetical protein